MPSFQLNRYIFVFLLPLAVLLPGEAAFSQEGAGKPDAGGFVEGRSGVVPEGAAELVTPATDAAIEKGLSWLSTQQNPLALVLLQHWVAT